MRTKYGLLWRSVSSCSMSPRSSQCLRFQLRKLRKELWDYAPPALAARYLDIRTHNGAPTESEAEAEPWWTATSSEESLADTMDVKSIVRVRTHAEDLAALTTPKVRCSVFAFHRIH